MCFCASGSFAASGVLAVVGAATIAISQKEDRLIAAIPLVFAVQQAIEGFQWLAPHPGTSSLLLGYGFLIFAFIFWPAYLPLATYRVELDRRRRSILRWFIFVGALTSTYLLWALLAQPLRIFVHPFGIEYLINLPLGLLGASWYLLATCGSLMASSRRSLQWFGAAAMFAALSSQAVFQSAFISVWCFFGALLSAFVFFMVKRKKRHL
ncbi:MAG: DUF6629 family protein [Patescibacteria group bacterium]